MKKLFLGWLFLTLVIVVPIPTIAEVDGDSIDLPPPIEFATPPELIVLPGTYAYVVPDVDADIFFYDGGWWRPWKGRWYCAQYYNSDWSLCENVPSFFSEIPPGWRNEYREHHWRGHPWNYQRITHEQLQQNWKDWRNNKHWENGQTWGVEGLNPETQSERPFRDEQPRQSQPQLREGTPEQSHHHEQQQGTHERREEE